MEQSIEGNTRKPGSGVACTPRGHFWGHDVKGSMRELLLDAHISISCMEERTVWTALRSGLQGCSAQIGLQGSDSGCTASSSYEAVTERATPPRSVFSPAHETRLLRVPRDAPVHAGASHPYGASNTASNTAHRHARVSSLSHTAHRQFICT